MGGNFITCSKLYRHGDTRGIYVTKEFASRFVNTNKAFEWRKLMTGQETRKEDEEGLIIPNDDHGCVAVEVKMWPANEKKYLCLTSWPKVSLLCMVFKIPL